MMEFTLLGLFFGGAPPAGGVFDRVLNDVFDSFGGRYAI